MGRIEEESSSLLINSFTDDEINVAQILLDLHNIITENDLSIGFKWGCKRRRSSLDDGVPSSRAPSPPCQKIDEMKSRPKAAEEGGAAVDSPITPLYFPVSETDDKSRRAFKKASRKTTTEEYIDSIQELTKRRALLRGEIETVTKYYNKLCAYNSELRAMKKEVLNSRQIKKEAEVEIKLTQSHQISVVPHQQPLVVDQTAERFHHHSLGPVTAQFHPSYNGLIGSVDRVGPSARNASGVDPSSQPLDASIGVSDERAKSAEARRMRRGIIKIKSMRRACGITLPETRWHQ